MSKRYEDWLFQAFETTNTEIPPADAGPINRDIARYYYQGYSATEIEFKMKLENVSTILQRLQTDNDELWKFLAGAHERNRELRMWLFAELETPGVDTTEDDVNAINRRNVMRRFLRGDSVDDIAKTVPDAVTILEDVETESPTVHAFIQQRNEFELDTETEVFLWNTERYTFKTFAQLLQLDDTEDDEEIVMYWRHVRTLRNSQRMRKYHLFIPEEMRKILDEEAVVDAELDEEERKRERKRAKALKNEERLTAPIKAWEQRQKDLATGGAA